MMKNLRFRNSRNLWVGLIAIVLLIIPNISLAITLGYVPANAYGPATFYVKASNYSLINPPSEQALSSYFAANNNYGTGQDIVGNLKAPGGNREYVIPDQYSEDFYNNFLKDQPTGVYQNNVLQSTRNDVTYDDWEGKTAEQEQIDEQARKSASVSWEEKFGNMLLLVIDFFIGLLMWVLGMLMSLAGVFVDFVSQLNKIAGSSIVAQGWSFTRDLLNFAFIIMLLVIAFSTIAGFDTYGMKKLLPRVILAALLVNFSLVISGAFLQLANVTTATILKSINDSPKTCQLMAGSSGAMTQGRSITCSLAKAAQLTGLTFEYSTKSGFFGLSTWSRAGGGGFTNVDVWSTHFSDNVGLVFKNVIFVIFIAMFTVALIMLAVTLTVRVVALAMLCMLSPVPFVFSVIPKAEKYAGMWWNYFIQYTFYLPAVFFFLVLAINVAGNIQKGNTIASIFTSSGSTAELKAVAGGNQELANLGAALFDMFFVSAFMVVAMGVSKQMGIQLANSSIGWGKNIVGKGVRVGTMPARVTAAAAGKAGKEAIKGAGTLAGRTPYLGGAMRGARAMGQMVKRADAFQEHRDQVAGQQKALKGQGVEELRAAMQRGNAGAAMELAEKGELKPEEFPMAMKMAPKGDYKEKVQKAWEKADPVSAILNKHNATKANAGTHPKKDDIKKDLGKALRKMSGEDFSRNVKAEHLDFARSIGIRTPLTKNQYSAAIENPELEDKAKDIVSDLRKQGDSLKPSEQTLVKWAEKVGGTDKDTPRTTSGTSPIIQPGDRNFNMPS